MKSFLTILGMIIFVSCQSSGDSAVGTSEENSSESASKEIFERNSQTVLNYLEAWQNENVDYAAFFSEDYESWSTAFGQTDTLHYADLPADDRGTWDRYDFELVTNPLNLLPGVDIETKEFDGSVRYYGEWKVISPASDSTAEKSGNLSLYQAYTFDEAGKITLILTFADFTGIIMYLNSPE